MNGIHDMGGMHGMGPINPEADEPVFHADWEARSFAMNAAARPFLANASARRYAVEILPPADYLRMSYYERWFERMVHMLLDRGLITRDELATGKASAASMKQTPRLRAESVPELVRQTMRKVLEGTPPRFRAGQQVRARNINPAGHTRLPRYVRGRVGTVEQDNGVFPLPDAIAHELPDRPQHNYSVRFAARELWGEQARPQDAVYLDLFDEYLEPA